jgi:hypothetical protein
VKDVRYLIERVGVKLIKMHHFPVGRLLNQNGLPVFMFVATLKIVIKGELHRRHNSSAFMVLPDGDIVPFIIPFVLYQKGINLVQSFVYRVGNDWFRLF